MGRKRKEAVSRLMPVSAHLTYTELDFFDRLAQYENKPLANLLRERIIEGEKFQELKKDSDTILLNLGTSTLQEKEDAYERLGHSISAMKAVRDRETALGFLTGVENWVIIIIILFERTWNLST